jgi:AcrR family transcriptional regulator
MPDATDSPSAITDGRRRRGQDNRARIVAAMLEIIHAGEFSPSAETVAARADVGLRTVFRHFQDMESLYREMGVVIEAELRAVMAIPFKAQDWRGRVLELIERRSSAFERIGPFLRASVVVRHRSSAMETENSKLATVARAVLKAQLPPEVARDQLTFEALDLLLSFETWSRLRRTQGLTPKRARETLDAAVRALID